MTRDELIAILEDTATGPYIEDRAARATEIDAVLAALEGHAIIGGGIVKLSPVVIDELARIHAEQWAMLAGLVQMNAELAARPPDKEFTGLQSLLGDPFDIVPDTPDGLPRWHPDSFTRALDFCVYCSHTRAAHHPECSECIDDCSAFVDDGALYESTGDADWALISHLICVQAADEYRAPVGTLTGSTGPHGELRWSFTYEQIKVTGTPTVTVRTAS